MTVSTSNYPNLHYVPNYKKTLGLKYPSAFKDFKKKISKVEMTDILTLHKLINCKSFVGKVFVYFFAFHYK